MACHRCLNNQNSETQEKQDTKVFRSRNDWKKRLEPLMLILCGIALLLSFLRVFEYTELAWITIFYCGFPIFNEAFQAAAKRKISVDVLISTAITACIAAHFVFCKEASSSTNHEHSYIFAAGEVAFIMAVGEWLERRTVAKARAGIEALIKRTPHTARRIDGDDETVISAAEVEIGDTLRILPGETVPADGIILNGNTSIDQSILTGEPLPVDKAADDAVFSGTINRFGSFTMRAVKTGQDSSLSRMIKLIEEAEQKKSPSERIADKWAEILVPTALLTAVLITLGSLYFVDNVEEALKRGITILVVFCPCSLVLAAPTAVIAAIGNASHRGILIRSGEALEQLACIETLCFDKTGTLTKGQPELVNIGVLTPPSAHEEYLLQLAASVEANSEHPLARCIVNAAKEKGIELKPAADFEMFAGQGVSAVVEGQRIYVGKKDFIYRLDFPKEKPRYSSDAFLYPYNEHDNGIKNKGASEIYIADSDYVLGSLVLADTLRETSKDTISKLRNIRIDMILLTGDNKTTAEHIAQQVGIENVQAELLPADKTATVEKLQREGKHIAMVGDGLNDAAALKTADVGIAMGKAGSDLTIEAADIVLVGDDIARLPFLIQLARKTKQTITGNIMLSMSINAVAVLLAAFGILGPVLGALVHNAGSLFVVFNASLLLRVKE